MPDQNEAEERQAKVLAFIAENLTDFGVAPTASEISAAVGASYYKVKKDIDELIRAGLLVPVEGGWAPTNLVQPEVVQPKTTAQNQGRPIGPARRKRTYNHIGPQTGK